MGFYVNEQLTDFGKPHFLRRRASYRSAVQIQVWVESGAEGILGDGGSTGVDDVSRWMLAVTEGLGVVGLSVAGLV